MCNFANSLYPYISRHKRSTAVLVGVTLYPKSAWVMGYRERGIDFSWFFTLLVFEQNWSTFLWGHFNSDRVGRESAVDFLLPADLLYWNFLTALIIAQMRSNQPPKVIFTYNCPRATYSYEIDCIYNKCKGFFCFLLYLTFSAYM